MGTLENTGDNFDGILVSLEKRMHDYDKNVKEPYEYVIFGHYDGMNVKKVEKWTDFRPVQVKRINAEPTTDEQILDVYSLRAIAPKNSIKEDLVKKGFKYDVWEKNGSKEDYTVFPMIACTLIHLTHDVVQTNSADQIISQLADDITKTIDTETNQRIDMNNINSSIYFSTGYSDIILLFRVRKLRYVDMVLGNLSKSKIGSNEIISDSYTITGFKKSKFTTFEEVKNALQNKSGISEQLLVSFTFRHNISFNEFYCKLDQELQNFCGRIGILKEETIKEAYSTFGNIDAVITLTIPLEIFPALYMKTDDYAAPFHPASELSQKFVSSIQNLILLPKKTSQECKEFDSHTYNNQIGTYGKNLEDFKTFVNKFGISLRNHDAIMQLLKTYQNLVSSSHGFDVKTIIGKALDCFFEDLAIDMNDIEEIKHDIDSLEIQETASSDDAERWNINTKKHQYEQKMVIKIDHMLDSIKIFREYIGTYLSDLSRSDRSFIEGRTMTHPSIGSLTKMLFAYNTFVNMLVKEFDSNEKNHAFVVVSGGCDTTKVDEIFSHIGAWRKNYKHLFVVSIPEAALFDIKGTLFRLAHECFHCFGDHKRGLRLEKAVYAVHEYVADIFSDYLFSDEVLMLDEDRIYCENKNTDEEWLTFRKGVREHFHQKFIACVTLLNESKIAIIFNKIKGGKEHVYLNDSIALIKKILSENFFVGTSYLSVSPDKKDYVRTLFGYVCVLGLYELRKLYTFIIEKEQIRSQERVCIYEKLLVDINYYLKDEWKIFDDSIKNYEYNYMNTIDFSKIYHNGYINTIKRLFMRIKTPQELTVLEDLETNKHKDTASSGGTSSNVAKKISDFYIYEYGEAAQIIMETMCECFADGMALKELGMCREENDNPEQIGKKAAEFLLSFFYESWDFKVALPFSMGGILRIGVDLELHYGISGTLDDNCKKAISQELENYKNYNIIGGNSNDNNNFEINSDAIIKRVEEILHEYSTYGIGKEIRGYVEECVKAGNGCMSRIYKNIRSTPELSNDDLYSFLKLWRTQGDSNADIRQNSDGEV